MTWADLLLIVAIAGFLVCWWIRKLPSRGKQNEFPAAQFAKYADWVVPYENTGLREWWLAKPEAERAELEQQIEELKAVAKWEELRPKLRENQQPAEAEPRASAE